MYSTDANDNQRKVRIFLDANTANQSKLAAHLVDVSNWLSEKLKQQVVDSRQANNKSCPEILAENYTHKKPHESSSDVVV